MSVPDWLRADPRVRGWQHRPARPRVCGTWPSWLPEPVRTAVAATGIDAPWEHQTRAAEAAHAGRHTLLATPTASGKTLAYLLPVLAATWGGTPTSAPPAGERTRADRVRELLSRPHTALYLAPTKALAHDQVASCRRLVEGGLEAWRVGPLDGDSTTAEREWARDHGTYLLSNPDMLHLSILPNHARWAGFLSRLRYVVIDEAHRYRGLFGAHVAQVLRRLRRICAHYGADPVLLGASATMPAGDRFFADLIGVDPAAVEVIDTDTAPHAALDFALLECADDLTADTADVFGRLVAGGAQSLCFVGSRVGAELVAERTRRLTDTSVLAYRAGYLPAERRELERELKAGRVRGVAATNALELGIDVSGMDAVVVSGFPGRLSALWQQVGRAGRSGRDATAVLVGRPDPLDAWLLDHPDQIFTGPIEATALHPENPRVLGPHLAAAAQELPADATDRRWFGPRTVELLTQLADEGVLRRRPGGWYWTHPARAVDAIDLRGLGGAVPIVDRASGRVIGEVDQHAADRTVHEGAIYLHQGEPWRVVEYAAEAAFVEPAPRAGFWTQPSSSTDIRILNEISRRRLGAGRITFGEVEHSSQVTGYLRRDERTGKVWDSAALDLPLRRFSTQAVWWTLPESAYAGLGLDAAAVAGAAHGAEHAAIGLVPMFAPCDRWDIGGVSTVHHPDTGQWTVFVHDGAAGGSGFAAAAYEAVADWLTATWDRLRRCPCSNGCPACVISPKCGSGNQVLDKQAATAFLGLFVAPARTFLPEPHPQPGSAPGRADPIDLTAS
ncbi:DEAD/DEAH box helicase [Granulicoccus phenolivorans]|uniref:DEAD/DEAH box helicase n=1 Tax=Granulicoccus phenolivorans TaxID=266854 RepID=UPI00041F44A3|nr:DEAD/DEAH box helicase [Granulicoccus phenolivorans]